MKQLTDARRIVIKVGTSTLTHKTGNINIRRVESLVRVLSDLKNAGKEIVLVSSGAIGVGAGKLGLSERPMDTPSKQACAAIGQCELMYLYDDIFSSYNHNVAQILLTAAIVSSDEKIQNVRNTFERLFKYNAIPIVNENDTVAIKEIEFGDNDTLSALVATIIDADLLILLTDIDGLYNDNPRTNPDAKRIPLVNQIDDYVISVACGAGSAFGTGGMITKVEAGKIAMENHIPMAILNGDHPSTLYDFFDGKDVGTIFMEEEE